MKMLKTIPQDRTFEQTRPSFAGPSRSSFHSLDLSNATDRFPIEFQRLILEELWGESYSKSWAGVMTGLPFHCRFSKDPVRYNTGQPMGAYSSWAMFTLSHHVVVRIAAYKSGCRLRNLPYILLGDDIVIRNNGIAREYSKILKHLGVEVSEPKTHHSKKMFEFAKR